VRPGIREGMDDARRSWWNSRAGGTERAGVLRKRQDLLRSRSSLRSPKTSFYTHKIIDIMEW